MAIPQPNPIQQRELIHGRLKFSVDNTRVEIATISGTGKLAPILFLHGFGSTKEDYVDMLYHPAFAKRSFLAYDAPGCGDSYCEDLSKISIPFLAETARKVLEMSGIKEVHIVGHSMGGLTALMLAHEEGLRVLSVRRYRRESIP